MQPKGFSYVSVQEEGCILETVHYITNGQTSNPRETKRKSSIHNHQTAANKPPSNTLVTLRTGRGSSSRTHTPHLPRQGRLCKRLLHHIRSLHGRWWSAQLLFLSLSFRFFAPLHPHLELRGTEDDISNPRLLRTCVRPKRTLLKRQSTCTDVP
jgi:hypothetical protein